MTEGTTHHQDLIAECPMTTITHTHIMITTITEADLITIETPWMIHTTTKTVDITMKEIHTTGGILIMGGSNHAITIEINHVTVMPGIKLLMMTTQDIHTVERFMMTGGCTIQIHIDITSLPNIGHRSGTMVKNHVILRTLMTELIGLISSSPILSH